MIFARKFFTVCLITGCCLAIPAAKAEDSPKPSAADASIIASQKASYPLTVCFVSGEKFGGEMGEPVEYVYKGRLIRLCCDSCIKKFNKEPDRFLGLIDAASKKNGK